jgi:uncharacterized protein YceH (UPF0502 family)
MELTAEAVRVLGCLVEKERTVPDIYPLTLNSLVSACNQSSNRWPIVHYDAGTVQRTLDDLKTDGFVRFVHPSHGERTTKFRQVVDERLSVSGEELTVLAVLFLRGPQTSGELRSRSERMHAFGSVGEVESVLRALSSREEPLVQLLERRPGEREARWTHLLAPTTELARQSRSERVADGPAIPDARRTALEDRVVILEAQVERLYKLLGEEPPEPPTV